MNTQHTLTPLEHAALHERMKRLKAQHRLKEAASVLNHIRKTTHQALKAGTKKDGRKANA